MFHHVAGYSRHTEKFITVVIQQPEVWSFRVQLFAIFNVEKLFPKKTYSL